DGGGRPLRRLRHHRRDHQRRRRPPQDPPHPPGAGGKALLPGGGGGGLCLPAVLRLLPGPLPASGSPDPGRQPGGEGGLSEGPRGAGPGPGPPGRPAACDRPRQRRNGIYQVRGGGRIRPPDLPRPGAGGSLRPDGAGGRGGHRPVRPESEAPADAAPGEGQGHHGPGPGVPDGLQGGGGGRHGQSAGHRRGIPHLRRAAGERGYRRPGKADPKARRGAHR
ncbi:Phosphatase YniC, partial [Dysosmobacter welbionis]